MTTTRPPSLCSMCDRSFDNHPACAKCSVLLEREFTARTRCRCGKYHNAPSDKNPSYCRPCMGELPLAGKPEGDATQVEEEEEETNETE